MNPYVKAALVIAAALLGAYGTAMMAVPVGMDANWNAIYGSMATAAGGAILGLMTDMRKQVPDDKA